ncbi:MULTISPECIES: glycosyltransferase family 4 protein [Exiguobacterium]|uniref:Glycosyltransferase family 4 protein n=1 Tax=Exiguobacterium acetylicum TaxID=41170 RepID=A0ABX8G9Y0_EXIAC|nr:MULTISPECIES: glycosyltransferase family 4 protein [Exiguobacterium]QWB30298.1 glycosyltransferase family 4 protein [Exiguobacterium acetylicum]
MKPHLLFLSWRDIKHPKAGGAEVFTHEMLRRVSDEYEITHFSPAFDGGHDVEYLDGVTYIRRGTALSVVPLAFSYYQSHAATIDLVVDQMNTHHFFTPLYVPVTKRALFIHQLTREIWQINVRPPFSYIGEWTETPRLQLYRTGRALTVSQSTADDLLAVGFSKDEVTILPEGLSFTPWNEEDWKPKEAHPTFLYAGRMSAYKGINDALQAFVIVKREYPEARFWVIGKKDEAYITEHLHPIVPEEMRDAITYFGFVSEEEKLERMSRATALLFPSKREGWGLTVSEAAAVGTPTIVYDAPGLRDAVQYGMTGYMAKSQTPGALAAEMRACLRDPEEYEMIQAAGHRFAQTLHWDHTGQAFRNWLQRELISVALKEDYS